MHKELVSLFHGIDLGMRGPDVSVLGPNFRNSDEDDNYMGVPLADSAVYMHITARTAAPFWPFTAFAHVNNIWLEFSDSIKTAASQAPLSYWINYFSTKFDRMPEHYYISLPLENKPVARNLYLWIFDKYCFEICEYIPSTPDMKRSLVFNAYLGRPALLTEHYGVEYYKITDSWDTVKVVYDTTLRR